MVGKTLGMKRLHASINISEDHGQLVPPWVIAMCTTDFFQSCGTHEEQKTDRFCIDCAQPRSFCSLCLASHDRSHFHLKIRRYIYSDVINRQDLSKHFDCSGIQPYLLNKVKVLFLKQRHQQQQPVINSRDYSCIVCEKSLQDNSLYCSVACKVKAVCGDNEKKEEIVHGDDHGDQKEETLNLPPAKRQNTRRRPRKEVPVRAPFF